MESRRLQSANQYAGAKMRDKKTIQKENNIRVLERMKNNNDNLAVYDVSDTWFETRFVDTDKIERMKKNSDNVITLKKLIGVYNE